MLLNTKLWLMRHGHIVLPAQKSFIGQTDLPLSPRGRAQIRSWKDFFAKEQLDIVLCSPLERCKQSAALLCPPHIPLRIDARFSEIHLGTWEGRSVLEIQENFAKDYALRGAYIDSFRPKQGESFEDLSARVHAALNEYLTEYAGKNILLMAHAGVNRVILTKYMSLPLRHVLNIPQPYACCTQIQC